MSQLSGVDFSANPVDNDNVTGTSCAKDSKSGWWFINCQQSSNLNGLYPGHASVSAHHGLQWGTWLGPTLSLKSCQMKIQPAY